MAESDLTAQQLREVLRYDPDTGEFTWLSKRSWKALAGARAGCVDREGYRKIFFYRFGLLCEHRLAWLYMRGHWPSGVIDHIDGDKGNNRFDNLRDVVHTENLWNTKRARLRNKSGLLGVTTCKRGGFVATIQTHGQRRYIGWFKTAEAAHQAYLEEKRRLHSTCTI